ncbi:hypothetical protein [Massilia sp. GCM10023247]|uniref:hypothetical protein n=1 Tax=Massilia sp. GCM10023247 TaxID=3252643 RepID=UPI00360CD717
MTDFPSLSELAWNYNNRLEYLAVEMVQELQCMFERHAPSTADGLYQVIDIVSSASLRQVRPGRGFYLIASDHLPPWERRNACTLTVAGLPVLYRGQAHQVQERLMSHLANRHYVQTKTDKGQAFWERCLKLDEVKGNKGGINVEDPPFDRSRWAVAVLPMPNSTSQMRELAEWAFDRVYGRPVASNERKQIPRRVEAEIEAAQARARALQLVSDRVFGQPGDGAPGRTAGTSG